jgi:ankyrin repeat protein
LIEGGANINERNKLGQTALHIACRMHNVLLAKYLIAQEADPEIRDIMSCNPAFYAKREGLTEIIELLPPSQSLEGQHIYDN